MILSNGQRWTRGLLSVGTALLLTLMTAAVLPQVPGHLGQAAAEEKTEAPKRPTRRTPALRMKVFEGMGKAQKVGEETKNPQAAIDVLQELLDEDSKSGKLNSYETAMVWRTIGAIHLQVADYPKAIQAFKQVAAQENIPYGLEAEIKYTLAQLMMATEDYKGAIKMLTEWLEVADSPGPDSYILLGQAYLLTEQYNPALANVQKGMTMAKERDMEVREQWYLMLRVIYYQKNDYKQTAAVLEELVRRWPKGEYWVQLAMMYGQLGEEDRQFDALETAYLQGFVTKEGELMLLAQMLATRDAPFKAAKVIDAGIRDGFIKPTPKIQEFLGEQWRRAQELEWALPELEKAAKASPDGEAYIRLAQVYLSRDQYKAAVTAVRNGIKKGKLKRPDEAEMLLGQALFYNNDFSDARQAFTRALKNEKTRKPAEQWMDYLDKEADRQKAINEYLKKKS